MKEYISDLTKDYTTSFNWYLDEQINENWAYVKNIFTLDECQKIIDIGKNVSSSSPLSYGCVGDEPIKSKNDFEKASKFRVSPVSWIRSDVKETEWIWQKLTDSINHINKQFFNYDLTEIQNLQFTLYDSEEKGFYGKHIDMAYRSSGTRKLSVSIQLSDSNDYEGGDLLLYIKQNPLQLPKEQGMALFFPSYTLHEVTPVTKGIRYSLVAWVLGPRFK
jgi:PKHD-type hydroxylase